MMKMVRVKMMTSNEENEVDMKNTDQIGVYEVDRVHVIAEI